MDDKIFRRVSIAQPAVDVGSEHSATDANHGRGKRAEPDGLPSLCCRRQQSKLHP